ncbi:DUF6404 family protein [Undibacterium sp. TC9W]|uniref:DUF6404 family protein n=1 Tax=Undibacterium sp. TC9W TaxID=3413053 RepID=UPI003BF143B0
MNTTESDIRGNSRELKRQAALKLLEKTGIMRSNYAPPYFRLLWRMGFDVPPPHFAQFWQNALFSGCFFATGWGALMYFFVWSKTPVPVTNMLTSAVIDGVLFGLALASYYAHGKRKHGLPSWQEFKPDSVA